jgi:hypothetical protein
MLGSADLTMVSATDEAVSNETTNLRTDTDPGSHCVKIPSRLEKARRLKDGV